MRILVNVTIDSYLIVISVLVSLKSTVISVAPTISSNLSDDNLSSEDTLYEVTPR